MIAVVLLILLASLMAATAYPALKGEDLSRAFIKTSAVALLAALAAIAESWALCAALAACGLGDFALARSGPRWFLAGMAAFALGHGLYILCFVEVGAQFENLLGWRILICAALASAAVWSGRFFAEGAGKLAPAMRGYIAIIGCMGVTALALPLGGFASLIILGAGLFIASDWMIGQRVFLKKAWRGQDAAIWASYYAAQLCLLIGVIFSAS